MSEDIKENARIYARESMAEKSRLASHRKKYEKFAVMLAKGIAAEGAKRLKEPPRPPGSSLHELFVLAGFPDGHTEENAKLLEAEHQQRLAQIAAQDGETK